jgi:hypothetical protein
MDEDERYFSTVSPMKNKLCKKWTDHLDFVMCMFAWKIFTLETFCRAEKTFLLRRTQKQYAYDSAIIL